MPQTTHTQVQEGPAANLVDAIRAKGDELAGSYRTLQQAKGESDEQRVEADRIQEQLAAAHATASEGIQAVSEATQGFRDTCNGTIEAVREMRDAVAPEEG